MATNNMDETAEEQEIEADEEMLEKPLPFADYGKEYQKLRTEIGKFEKEYDEREKVIDRIMEYGTGVESEKALRMFSTPVLKKWEDSLESFRKSQLSKK